MTSRDQPLSREIQPRFLNPFPDLSGVRAFFTTRIGGVSTAPFDSLNLGFNTEDDSEAVGKNWSLVLAAQGMEGRTPVVPRLCHGAALLNADESHVSGQAAETERVGGQFGADAVFTRTPGRIVAVTTADCLASLVVDTDLGCVAAVHAGWRGSRSNILGLTLQHLFLSGFCRPESTHIALGPCLSPTALEVGFDVAETLPQAHVTTLKGRPHFDLRGCNRAQAIAAGAFADHITEHGGCTRRESDLYFSHRRAQAEGLGVTGRLAACIALV